MCIGTNDWKVSLSCLACDGDLEHVNGTSNGVLAVTVVQCSGCRRSFEITTRLRAFVTHDATAARRQREKRARSAA